MFQCQDGQTRLLRGRGVCTEIILVQPTVAETSLLGMAISRGPSTLSYFLAQLFCKFGIAVDSSVLLVVPILIAVNYHCCLTSGSNQGIYSI